MSENEIKALVSLLEDTDEQVSRHVENEIRNLGEVALPFLESHWEENALSPPTQKRIEDLIHELQYENFAAGLLDWKENRQDDLLEGMWLVARYQYPDLNYDKLKVEINQLYFDAWLDLREEIHPKDAIKVMNRVFFEKHKFTANTKNFHSPANSLINQVMETRKGNPISLCVIYMLVAQRLGLPIYGVNLPSLFVLTYKTPQIQFYINVFNKGVVFNQIDIQSYLKQLKVNINDSFFQPCSNLQIIKRSLKNLIVAFKKNAETQKAEEIQFVFDKLG